MRIRDSVALVTGANRGIGRPLVEALLARDVRKIYATARRRADLDPIIALDHAGRGRVVPLELDVSDAGRLAEVAAMAEDVRLLINNAGVAGHPADNDAIFRHQFAVNAFGLLHVARAFGPALVANRGIIVNVETVVGQGRDPRHSRHRVYHASKAAARSLIQTLRADLGKVGIGLFDVDGDCDDVLETLAATDSLEEEFHGAPESLRARSLAR